MPSTRTALTSFASEAIAQKASFATALKSPFRPIGRALGISSERLRTSNRARRRVTSGSRPCASIARSATSSAAAPKIAGIPASSKCRPYRRRCAADSTARSGLHSSAPIASRRYSFMVDDAKVGADRLMATRR